MKKLFIFYLLLIIGCKSQAILEVSPPIKSVNNLTAKVKMINITVILPVFNKVTSEINQAIIDAITMSLFSEPVNQQIKIKLINCDDSDSSIKLAINEAINNHSALIIGPISTKATNIAASYLKDQSINLLSFANGDKLIAKNIFLLGHNIKKQVNYLSAKLNEYNKISKLYLPLINNQYGNSFLESLNQLVIDNKISIAQIERYSNQYQLKLAIENIVKLINSSNYEQPVGLLLLERGEQLKYVHKLFEEYKLDYSKVKLLGLSRWQNQDILNYQLINDAFFIGEDEKNITTFIKQFEKLFGYKPHLIALLAYESINIAKKLATLSNFSSQTLNHHKFLSYLNEFGFDENHIADRQLKLFQIIDSQIIDID